MSELVPASPRSGLAPALGAAAIAVLAVVMSITLIVWRGGAQRDILDAQTARCRQSDPKGCDALRSQCIKRSGEACEALAESILASGPNADTRDAMSLLNDACQLRDRAACVRAARKLLAGDGVARDAPTAAKLLERGCDLGAKEACALRETVP